MWRYGENDVKNVSSGGKQKKKINKYLNKKFFLKFFNISNKNFFFLNGGILLVKRYSYEYHS
jgi:hypothetical protein